MILLQKTAERFIISGGSFCFLRLLFFFRFLFRFPIFRLYGFFGRFCFVFLFLLRLFLHRNRQIEHGLFQHAELHQQQQRQPAREDEDADELARRQRADKPALIVAEKLNRKAPRTVQHHVPAGDGAERLLLGQLPDEEHAQQEEKHALHDLRRQQRYAGRRRAARGEDDRNRRRAFHTIAAAREHAADTAERVSNHQRRDEIVRQRKERQLLDQRIDRHAKEPADQRAIEHKPFPQGMQQIGGVRDDLIKLHQPEEHLRADKAENDRPERGGKRLIFRKTGMLPREPQQHERREHADGR